MNLLVDGEPLKSQWAPSTFLNRGKIIISCEATKKGNFEESLAQDMDEGSQESAPFRAFVFLSTGMKSLIVSLLIYC
jgi:hypothetical protein